MVAKDLTGTWFKHLLSGIVLAGCVVGAQAAEDARPDFSAPVANALISNAATILLCVTLAVAVLGLFLLDARRRNMLSATGQLAALIRRLKAGEASDWNQTGVPAIDDIAVTVTEFDGRLRRKRAILGRLNEELVRSGGGGPGGFNNQLRAIIDALPVGVLVAEAPSGRIIEGNRALEEVLRRPTVYAEGMSSYSHWAGSVHENGEPVLQAEYPLVRALSGEERPVLECRHHRGDGTWGWINIVGAPLRNDQGEIIAAIVAVTDIDEIRSAEDHRRSMNMELHHRVNNSLAMIQGIANITARTATDFTCFRNSFSERIQCLSRVSTLLVKKSWSLTPMKELVMTALAWDTVAMQDRVSISGDDVELRSEVALALGMALHELLSNAERHGALSTDAGKVTVDWRVADSEGRRLLINWKESGGPVVGAPQNAGVGQYLMKSVLARQFGGDVNIFFESDGLRAEITAEI